MGGIEGLEGPIIIALVSVGGIIITLLFNIKAQNAVSRGQFATLLNDLIREHSGFLEKEPILKNVYECSMHALSYFDLLDRIAYLCINKKIPLQLFIKAFYILSKKCIYSSIPKIHFS